MGNRPGDRYPVTPILSGTGMTRTGRPVMDAAALASRGEACVMPLGIGEMMRAALAVLTYPSDGPEVGLRALVADWGCTSSPTLSARLS